MSVLSRRHEAFINEYLKDYNATRAYQKIYNCDYDSARSNGARLLANDNIKTAIDQKLQEITSKISEEWILREMFENYKRCRDNDNEAMAKSYLELFGKYKTMFTDRTENVNITSAEDFISKAVETRKPTANNDKLTKPDNDNKTHSQPEDAKLLKNNNLQGKS